MAAEEPERRQLLEVAPGYVRFRHELARNAIRSSIPIAARRRLHAEILGVLLATNADPADIVHHAEAAGAENVVADYALVAARRAAAVGSNREAYSHYRRASNFLDRRSAEEQAAVLEELAAAAYTVYRLEDAFPAIERAIAEWTALRDWAALGRCTLLLSRLHWHAGDGDAARRTALEAVEILEPLGESVELARAYSGLSQLENLAEANERAIVWGERALELANRLGDETTRAHVLVNLAQREARRGSQADRAPARGARVRRRGRQPPRGDPRALQPRLCTDVLGTARAGVPVRAASAGLRGGERGPQPRVVRRVTPRVAPPPGRRTGTRPSGSRRARSRRASPWRSWWPRRWSRSWRFAGAIADAAERLAELAAQAVRTSEPQRIVPVLELELEWALTRGTPLPLDRLGRLLRQSRAAGARRLGCDPRRGMGGRCRGRRRARRVEIRALRGHAQAGLGPGGGRLRRGRLDVRPGADAVAHDDEDSLAEAIEIARELGAEPLAGRVVGRMRELELRVPPGPREATRANPAGLTARQLEVLALVADGLTNAEIAERLVVSPRTAEHHVAAVLTKLGASSRRDAARRASELGLEARR